MVALSARGVGKEGSGPPGLQTSRFGIKAKLYGAFAVMAALTVVAATVAWSVFGDIDRSVKRVTNNTVPDLVAALRLAEESAAIIAAAPAIIASKTQEERRQEKRKLDQRAAELTLLIEGLEPGGESAPARTGAGLEGLMARFLRQLDALDRAVAVRLDQRARREALQATLSHAHHAFLTLLEPLVDDSYFNLVIEGEVATAESTGALTGLVEGGVARLDRLLTIKAEGNLLAGLLAEVLHSRDKALLGPLRERSIAAVAALERNFKALREDAEKARLGGALAPLLAFAGGNENLFAIKRATQSLTEERIESLAEELKRAHDSFRLAVTPMIDDATFDLVLATEDITAKSRERLNSLIAYGAESLHVLLALRAEGNLAAGLLNEAAGVAEAAALGPLGERFTAAEGQMRRLLEDLPHARGGPGIAAAPLPGAVQDLVEVGVGESGLFATRRAELRASGEAQGLLVENRTLAEKLGGEVEGIVAAARADSAAAAQGSALAIERGTGLLALITFASIAAALLVVTFYVARRIIRPIGEITRAMGELAAGDTTVEIPGRRRRDELGRMAEALGVFRDTAIEVQRSNLKELEATRSRLSDAIESISEAFSLYDAQDRLVVCNSKYRTLLYPEIAEGIAPGMTFEAIVRRAAEGGYIKDAEGGVEEWLSQRLARHRDPGEPHIQQRSDGRWIIVSERKTRDGGTVAVYSDITDLKAREEDLARKSAALEQLSNQLSKYLSPQVYESIFTGRQEVKVAGRRKKLTVFFSDIAGFTETADRLESEELTGLLNHYLTEMSAIALKHGATIDKYIGDAIVIFFGDPETKGVRQDALACVKMALEMRGRMIELQKIWRECGIEKPLQCRIGINTGYCTVGNFGSEDRMDYTIIGGGVNLASRLESAATPGEILISYETYALVKEEIVCEEEGEITVKGLAYPVMTYRALKLRGDEKEADGLIHEDQPNLKLDLNPAAMTDEERTRASETLKCALRQLETGKG